MTKLCIWLTTDKYMLEIEKDFCIWLFLLLIGSIATLLYYDVIRLICFCGIIFYSIKILVITMKYITEDQY